MALKKVAVIGSGISGIATAIRLSSKFDVTVYEAGALPGGKLSEIKNGEFRFDAGPSLFTMPELIEDLFLLHEKNPSDYFKYKQLDTICRYFYEDGLILNASADPERFAEDISSVTKDSPESVKNYLLRCAKKYELTADLFLNNGLSLKSFVSKKALKALTEIFKLDIFSTLHKVNHRRFKDSRLIQLFDRYATYNGSNPYSTPGIMSIIPHLEYNMGAYMPEGGMYSIIKSLSKLAKEAGINFRFNTPVEKITVRKGKAEGVVTSGKEEFYDIIVSNADIHHTYRKLLKDQRQPERILKQPKSSSALVFYWNMSESFPDLDLHNIFFTKDYKAEFDHIFNKKSFYHDPTIYINISSKHCTDDAPEGCENWFVMINVPHNTGQDWEKIRKEARKSIIRKLSSLLKNNIEEYIDGETFLDPVLIEQRTSSYGGALYGNSSNNKFSAFLRHANYSSKIKNLYFCGGSVHPGGGIPLCLLSAKIVSEMISHD